MAISDKKMNMAEKMYTQNSKGGKGASPKYVMKGKDNKFDKGGEMGYSQNGKGTTKGKGMGHNQSGGNEKFENGYHQADINGSFTGKYKMAN